MNNYIRNATRIIISLAFLNTLYACDSSNNTTAGNNTSVAKTEIPAALQKLTLPGTPGEVLRAFIIIDGSATRTEMTIDPAGAGSASASITGLTLAVHTVDISYEYTDAAGTLIVATASKSVDLTSGSGSISFAAIDYDLASYDFDSDSISNAAELAAGTDPRVAGAAGAGPCVMGTSLLDNCTLG
ncbi:MAG: hypothetical protein OEY66_09355 [Gammaproteobacteria bacterium]|nr:hypothetical protein [Gammaproteobacteria bacterium]